MTINPGLCRGEITAPPSKSHAHRLFIANFLADGAGADLADCTGDSADILATKRSLRALLSDDVEPVLDCGESGSTLRFLSPVAAALGKRPRYKLSGRLSERPNIAYESLESGIHELSGNVSSQFVTGLLFALPLLEGDSEIRFLSPLESRGYVDMTLDVIRKAGVSIEKMDKGFSIPGRQRYRRQASKVEGDWSGAAFWYAMNALGSDVKVIGLNENSAQPDRAIGQLLPDLPDRVDVSQFPDIFPVLTVVAAARPGKTVFEGITRLRLKECDRVAAMADVLGRFGAKISVTETSFCVEGADGAFSGGKFHVYGDHRIAMSVAVGSTIALDSVEIDDHECANKSYPGFFELLQSTQNAPFLI